MHIRNFLWLWWMLVPLLCAGSFTITPIILDVLTELIGFEATLFVAIATLWVFWGWLTIGGGFGKVVRLLERVIKC